MASAPPFHGPESFESHGSGSLNTDYSPPGIPPTCLVPYSAAPIFPINGDDFPDSFGMNPLEPCFKNVNTSSPICSLPLVERHVFLCFKEPQSWPPVVDAAEFDRLPRFLAAAIKARKKDMSMKTRLTICEGRDGTDSSNGDVLIFPDFVRYRGLTHFDVDAFVEEVLVHNREWVPGRPERLCGMHIFVCAHQSHDIQCGILGPVVIKKFRDELSARGLTTCVAVKPCSHVGGPKYAANFICYGSNGPDAVSSHCYGYVTPDDVSNVLDELLEQGYLVTQQSSCCGQTSDQVEQTMQNLVGHADEVLSFRIEDGQAREQVLKQSNNGNGNSFSVDGYVKVEGRKVERKRPDDIAYTKRHYCSPQWWQASWWFDFWEREDTLAALAVTGAAATVAIAYYLYRNERL